MESITQGERIDFVDPPPEDRERDAFVALNPAGFFIRHPPPPHQLSQFNTRDDQLFQTIHMGGAEVSIDKWSLVVTGLVEQPFSVTLKTLRRLPSKTVTAFHECYGSPLVPPTKALWRVGNVTWKGVPLHYLLGKAKPKPQARFVWSEGLDRGSFGGIEADRYQKDLPIDKAVAPEVLVAYEMNSRPLTKNRGGPVRLVVPGWFGTNSTKWLSKIKLEQRRASGHFTTTFYNERVLDGAEEVLRPVWKVQPNSMIVTPVPDAVLSGPQVAVEGWAWSCDGVGSVHVSNNLGGSWMRAALEDRVDFSWQRFRVVLLLDEGSQILMAKAVSKDGATQPLEKTRNHVHCVRITVR